jgi:mRNA-degrading endonuclease RelE of RelBE toxin-antitoxin system
MPNDVSSIQILLTQRFKQDLRKLAKRYRSIRQDLTPLIDRLQQGETPGDRISGNKYQVIKVRLQNSNIQKGKSAGYRVIYYLKTETTITLVTIYSKSNRTDISNKVIEEIIQTFEQKE